MDKLKPAHLVLGCVVVFLLSVLIPQSSDRPSGELSADIQSNSGNDSLKSSVEGREGQRGRVRWQSVANGAAALGQAPKALSEGPAPKSRYEELMASLEAIATSAQPIEQLGAILKRDASELSVAERAEILTRIARLVADRNLDLGLELAGTLEDFRDRHGFVKAILEAVVERDPGRAAGWASRLPDAQLLQSAYSTLGMKWGQADIEACRAWAEGVPDPAARLSALEGLTWAWTLKDPSAAYGWAAQLPEPEMRDKIFVKMAKMITTQDPQHGSEWALGFPEGPGRAEALDFAVFQWASKNLEAAAAWSSQIEDPALRESSFAAVARSWSNHDPASATVWVAQLPEGQGRMTALTTTARKWAEVNPAAAAQWIEQLAQTQAREDLFANVTSALTRARPSVAGTLLNSVFDPSLRAAGEQILASRQDDPRSQTALNHSP